MSTFVPRAGALLLSVLLAACGGGGGGGSTSVSGPPSGGAPPPPVVTVPSAGMRVEESDAAVTLSGDWTKSEARLGWSAGTAMQTGTAGATASISFTGTSIRWIGSRGRGMGIALLSIDGVQVREVDLFARPSDEAHTQVVTVYDLTDAKHTLTIQVSGRHNPQGEGNLVVVDAFDVQPGTTISHWQDTNPDVKYSAAWTKTADNGFWSGGGVSNLPELPVTAHESSTAGESVTLPFRGTALNWVGYRGPDAGIATVQIDGGGATEVDLYSPTVSYQAVVFAGTGLADVNHTLTIQVTGRKNAASTGARVVVDAFDVMTPGRRYEESDKTKITYAGGLWTMDNEARVWTEGVTATSHIPGATATFTFTGTSVSWIGCEKGSAGGTADVSIDGVFQKQVSLNQNYPVEGYQMTVFRADGLSPGAHTLQVKVVSNTGSYVVVDAFDVRP
jgi:hypothetical protein